MSIVTKTGDKGKTRLLSGEEVSKADLRIEASGVLDELNCHVGLARALLGRVKHPLCGDLNREIEALQLDLSRLAGELASLNPADQKLVEPTGPKHVEHIEGRIRALEGAIVLPRSFIIPGSSEASAAMDVARTVARRLERAMVALGESGAKVNPQSTVYANRLSDYIFMLARAMEQCAGVAFQKKG